MHDGLNFDWGAGKCKERGRAIFPFLGKKGLEEMTNVQIPNPNEIPMTNFQ